MSKPREWWIDKRPWQYGDEFDQHDAYTCEPVSSTTELWHVVEKSRLDAAEAELGELRKLSTFTERETNRKAVQQIVDLQREIQILKAQLEKCKEQRDEVTDKYLTLRNAGGATGYAVELKDAELERIRVEMKR